MKFKAKAIFEIEKEWELEAEDQDSAVQRVQDLISTIEVMYGAVMTYSEVGPIEGEEEDAEN